MSLEILFILLGCLLVVSFLYSTVGHAGASGYIAVMSLMGFAPDFIKPAALVLNIGVAAIASWQYFRAGHFQWGLFWPFAAFSVPGAFIGGYLSIPVHVFKIILGLILLFSAMVIIARLKAIEKTAAPSVSLSMGVGGVLGFLAGLTGTGGGIFLTPMMILFKWAGTKTASATSALFILVNSISGLLGFLSTGEGFPPARTLAPLLLTVLIGGATGSYLGSRKLSKEIVKICLSCVLLIASAKLLFG